MKVVPVAVNHIKLELDNGTVLDVNDGTSVKQGGLVFRTEESWIETTRVDAYSVMLEFKRPLSLG